MLRSKPASPMRALHVSNVRHRRTAELRRTRHSPTRHDKLALAIRAAADDRGHLVGEDRGERRQIARPVVLDGEQVADGRLALGDRIQIAHGAPLWRESLGRKRAHSARVFLLCSRTAVIFGAMPDTDKLMPADPSDLADALAFALRFHGRKRMHNADEIMADIVAKRLVEHLERAGFVVMKRPAEVGAAALRRGFTG